MGSGIAASFAQAGLEVVLVETQARALESGLSCVGGIIDGGPSRVRSEPRADRAR
jgi:3-hydroxyacyl-CoA dehydrogenase